MSNFDDMSDMDLKGRFIAQAFVEELEDIEKAAAAGFFANLGRSALRSGAKMMGGVSKKVGGNIVTPGAARTKAVARKYTGKSMTDLAKFYGGKGLMWAGKNPRAATAVAGTGAIGTGAVLS